MSDGGVLTEACVVKGFTRKKDVNSEEWTEQSRKGYKISRPDTRHEEKLEFEGDLNCSCYLWCNRPTEKDPEKPPNKDPRKTKGSRGPNHCP